MVLEKAVTFASNFHEGQKRKYNDKPYIIHPIRVAFILASVLQDTNTIAAGILHDVIEDTEATEELVLKEFGPLITKFVMDVSDHVFDGMGNRAKRKQLYKEQILKSNPPSKSVKLADILDNAQSIIEHDPGFAKVWMAEKQDLLPCLSDGHPQLYLRVSTLIHNYYNKPKEK